MNGEIQWIDPEIALPPTGMVVLAWAEKECGPGLYLAGLDCHEGWINYPALERITVMNWAPILPPSGEFETLYMEEKHND